MLNGLSYSSLIKTLNFPSKIGNFQHLPHFGSIHEAPWMQIFVFLRLCGIRNEVVFLILEHSSLRGGVKQKKHK